MNAVEYQKQAKRTDKINWAHINGSDVAILGAMGELGSLASVVKKRQRDQDAYVGYEEHFTEELGDVLWYVSIIASRLGICFNEWPPSKSEDESVFSCIYLLSEKINKLKELKFALVAPQEPSLDQQNIIYSILEDLQTLACAIGSELSRVASNAINKTLSYWCSHDNTPARQFDENFPFYEQLPRKFHIDFISIDGGKTTLMMMNGMQLGDRLTDNSHKDDGYRFHDIFHLAGVATLGWSPVMRSLLRAKRKSNPQIDEVEDGARAAIIEEAIINHVYDFARPNFLEGVKRVDLDIIKRIQRLVRGYEVSECEPWEWEDCILKGFKAFRALKEQGRGRLEIDADHRMITLQELPGS